MRIEFISNCLPFHNYVRPKWTTLDCRKNESVESDTSTTYIIKLKNTVCAFTPEAQLE